MPWCNKCHEEYREGFTVCADCGQPLDDFDALVVSEEKYNDPDIAYSYARSKITPGYVKVYEISGNHKGWFKESLDELNIPHEVKIVQDWEGIRAPKFHEVQHFYVPPEYQSRVELLIAEEDALFAESYVIEDYEEYEQNDEGTPQMICENCGKKIDFDYVKCPFCKHDP